MSSLVLNHVWQVHLTTVPTSLGFSLPWFPRVLPQRWPFCWWLAVVVDHYSRRFTGFAIFRSEPTASDLTRLLGRLRRVVGSLPSHLITDQGTQFLAEGFRRWCRRRRVTQRFGAVGRYGSIAVVERFIRSIKGECTRVILVSWRRASLEGELGHYVHWFNGDRPHESAAAHRTRCTSVGLPQRGDRASSPALAGHVARRVRDRKRSCAAGRASSSPSPSTTEPAGSTSRSYR